jgi:hypothetical protein
VNGPRQPLRPRTQEAPGGRTIVKSEARPFPDDRGNTVYNPRLTLDDGTTVSFMVEETETDYGVRILLNPPMK